MNAILRAVPIAFTLRPDAGPARAITAELEATATAIEAVHRGRRD